MNDLTTQKSKNSMSLFEMVLQFLSNDVAGNMSVKYSFYTSIHFLPNQEQCVFIVGLFGSYLDAIKYLTLKKFSETLCETKPELLSR